jgi:hypothetical protein
MSYDEAMKEAKAIVIHGDMIVEAIEEEEDTLPPD